jgi:hypothetical protein
VKRDVRRKLDAREYKRVEFHGAPISLAAEYTELGPQTTTIRHGFLSCIPFMRFMGSGKLIPQSFATAPLPYGWLLPM